MKWFLPRRHFAIVLLSLCIALPCNAQLKEFWHRYRGMTFSEILTALYYDPYEEKFSDSLYYWVSLLYLSIDKELEDHLRIKPVDCFFQKTGTRTSKEYDQLGPCLFRLQIASLRTDKIAGKINARVRLPFATEDISVDILWRPSKNRTVSRALGIFLNRPNLKDDESLLGTIQIRFPHGTRPEKLFGSATKVLFDSQKGDLDSIYLRFEPVQQNPVTGDFEHKFTLDVYQENHEDPIYEITGKTDLNFLRPQNEVQVEAQHKSHLLLPFQQAIEQERSLR